MGYVKPGVEITQVQRSFSPTLISPDLAAVVIGPAYKIVPSEGDGSYSYSKFTAGMTITLSGVSSGDTVYKTDASSIYMDLVMTSGTSAGSRLHIDHTQISGIVDGTNTFTVSTGIASSTWNGASVYVGYRALNMDPQLDGLLTIGSLSDIDAKFGGNQVQIDNPLVFGISLAMANTLTTVNAVNIKYDEFASVTGSGTLSSEHIRARNILETREVYAVAPLTYDSTEVGNYISHVNNMSVATEKKERILFYGPEITWYNTGGSVVTDPSQADKTLTAQNIRDAATAVGMKRAFRCFPDVMYFKEGNRQVQKLKPTYIASIYGMGTTEYAILAKSYTLANGTTYQSGTIITETVYAALKADTTYYQFDAYIPVPGSFFAAMVAGQVSGQLPEQGHTNLPIAGPAMLKYSTDFFTESQLNIIAAGGVYIMTEVGGTVFCRHQLSTDMTSIERRELNITKSVDYTAKYIRNVVAGYIGRSLITPAFLTVLAAILSGLGTTLKKEGRLNDFKVTGIKQDEVSKDTVRVSIEILPKYPVNYIKVDLIF